MSHLTLFHLQIDTSRQLEWLKGLKKSHGSVEKSFLMEAKAINEHGVYRVGCVSEDVEKSIETLTHDAVIQLKLPTNEKRITLDDLKDLQNKLMLIAAKASNGKEDVDRFVDVSFRQTGWGLSILTFKHFKEALLSRLSRTPLSVSISLLVLTMPVLDVSGIPPFTYRNLSCCKG